METIQNINQKLADIHEIMACLKAMNANVQSVIIKGDKPIIRIQRNAHCDVLIKNGIARYVSFGFGCNGRFRQGVFEHSGCRVIWSESLH